MYCQMQRDHTVAACCCLERLGIVAGLIIRNFVPNVRQRTFANRVLEFGREMSASREANLLTIHRIGAVDGIRPHVVGRAFHQARKCAREHARAGGVGGMRVIQGRVLTRAPADTGSRISAALVGRNFTARGGGSVGHIARGSSPNHTYATVNFHIVKEVLMSSPPSARIEKHIEIVHCLGREARYIHGSH